MSRGLDRDPAVGLWVALPFSAPPAWTYTYGLMVCKKERNSGGIHTHRVNVIRPEFSLLVQDWGSHQGVSWRDLFELKVHDPKLREPGASWTWVTWLEAPTLLSGRHPCPGWP